MKVMGKYILVKQHKTKAVSEGGIVLTDNSIEALPFGEVLQVGPDGLNDLIGMVVLFDPISARPLGIKEDHVLIEPTDILVILEEGEY